METIIDSINELMAYPSYFYDMDGEYDEFTWKDFLSYANGNVQYALALRSRIEWQHPATLVEEDLVEGEIIVHNNQYVMTNGIEIEINEI